MARVKYAPGETPLLNKHAGFTFQPNHYGQSMFSGQKNDRRRTPSQSQAQQNLMRCVRYWRTMSAGTQTNWETFAATYPQASRRNPALFLTGYQLFLKRNHYKFLNEGIDADFMEAPKVETLPDPSITFTIEQSSNCVDATENYIARFGIIPASGQFVILKAFPMARDSGQFFTPIVQTLEILESYIDGLFVSIAFAAGTPAVSLSVYLSKPFYRSVKYAGTKVKYMSCFSGKSFLSLTDTPDSFAGQSEKQVAVKADETGLEFITGGGGGLTCETLAACPLIIQMLAQIQANSAIISEQFNTSIPPVNLGILYNRNAATNINLSSSDDWLLPTRTQILSLQTALGGSSVAGAAMKEVDLTFWASIVGNTNLTLLNIRGSGSRQGTPKVYQSLYLRTSLYTSTPYFGAGLYLYDLRSGINNLYMIGTNQYNAGYSIRFVKDATGQADGTTGFYVGNNGRLYRTVVVNGLSWLADNLAETVMRDGSAFLERPDATEWNNDLSQAYCFFANDINNV